MALTRGHAVIIVFIAMLDADTPADTRYYDTYDSFSYAITTR